VFAHELPQLWVAGDVGGPFTAPSLLGTALSSPRTAITGGLWIEYVSLNGAH
jgi:hypothetical protein